MRRIPVFLELMKSHVSGEGYIAHLVVGDARIVIDRPLPDVFAADDLHNSLAKEFSKCGVDLVEDLQDEHIQSVQPYYRKEN